MRESRFQEVALSPSARRSTDAEVGTPLSVRTTQEVEIVGNADGSSSLDAAAADRTVDPHDDLKPSPPCIDIPAEALPSGGVPG